jgi:hypothetical protein
MHCLGACIALPIYHNSVAGRMAGKGIGFRFLRRQFAFVNVYRVQQAAIKARQKQLYVEHFGAAI